MKNTVKLRSFVGGAAIIFLFCVIPIILGANDIIDKTTAAYEVVARRSKQAYKAIKEKCCEDTTEAQVERAETQVEKTVETEEIENDEIPELSEEE